MRGLIVDSSTDARLGLFVRVPAASLAGCNVGGGPDSVTAVDSQVTDPKRPVVDLSDCACGHPVSDRILFDTDKAEITPAAQAVVTQLAATIRKYPAARFTIEGHADERGTREYNLALGARRANAFKTAVLALGVSETQIENVVSYGKERPVAVGSNEAAWAQNRRAVVVLHD
jgi:peptidoglycan-associated lipoprotein